MTNLEYFSCSKIREFQAFTLQIQRILGNCLFCFFFFFFFYIVGQRLRRQRQRHEHSSNNNCNGNNCRSLSARNMSDEKMNENYLWPTIVIIAMAQLAQSSQIILAIRKQIYNFKCSIKSIIKVHRTCLCHLHRSRPHRAMSLCKHNIQIK